jgi:hypothetical protein
MTVTIDIDLKAKDAFAKLALLERRFRQLEDRLGDLGADLDLSVGEQIQELVDELEDVEDSVSSLSQEIQQAADSLDDIDPEVTHTHVDGDGDGGSGSDGGGGGGGNTAKKPGFIGRGKEFEFDPGDISRRIEDRFDLPQYAIDPDTLDGMSIDQANAEIAEFVNQQRDAAQSTRNFGPDAVKDGLLFGDDGTFFGDREEDKDLSDQIDADFSLRDMLFSEARSDRVQEQIRFRDLFPDFEMQWEGFQRDFDQREVSFDTDELVSQVDEAGAPPAEELDLDLPDDTDFEDLTAIEKADLRLDAMEKDFHPDPNFLEKINVGPEKQLTPEESVAARLHSVAHLDHDRAFTGEPPDGSDGSRGKKRRGGSFLGSLFPFSFDFGGSGGGSSDKIPGDFRSMLPDPNEFGKRAAKNFSGMPSILRRVNNGFGRMGNRLRRLKPNMRTIWNFIALLLPLFVAFGTQALGVAAALGAVGAAGAGLIGLGLMGHAENMGDAMEQAKQQIQDFKKEVFQVFQPAMEQFAPIQARFFDWAPDQMTPINQALQGLTRFEDTVFRAFKGASQWVGEFIEMLTANEEAISQLALRFGSILGSNIIGFFEWLIREAQQNQEMLIQLGHALKQIGIIIYNVSKAIARIVTVFTPLFDIFAAISRLLNNRVILAIVTFLTTVLGLIYVVTALTLKIFFFVQSVKLAAAILASLGGGGGLLASVAAGLGVVKSYAIATTLAFLEMASAAQIAAAAIAATGVGALLVGGGVLAAKKVTSGIGTGGSGSGLGGSAPGGRGQQVVYNDNREFKINNQGEADRSTEQRLKDTIKNVAAEEAETGRPGRVPKTVDQKSTYGPTTR